MRSGPSLYLEYYHCTREAGPTDYSYNTAPSTFARLQFSEHRSPRDVTRIIFPFTHLKKNVAGGWVGTSNFGSHVDQPLLNIIQSPHVLCNLLTCSAPLALFLYTACCGSRVPSLQNEATTTFDGPGTRDDAALPFLPLHVKQKLARPRSHRSMFEGRKIQCPRSTRSSRKQFRSFPENCRHVHLGRFGAGDQHPYSYAEQNSRGMLHGQAVYWRFVSDTFLPFGSKKTHDVYRRPSRLIW